MLSALIKFRRKPQESDYNAIYIPGRVEIMSGKIPNNKVIPMQMAKTKLKIQLVLMRSISCPSLLNAKITGRK